MPNHIYTEVCIPLETDKLQQMRSLICNDKGEIDFEILLPIPLNYWQGSVGSKHKEKFAGNGLDWCSEHWGTKWNAYGPASTDYEAGCLILRMKTAWSTPRGWMCALFNKTHASFTYRYLNEGDAQARSGYFKMTPENAMSDMDWDEKESLGDTDHLGKLLWGEEAWKEIQQERNTP